MDFLFLLTRCWYAAPLLPPYRQLESWVGWVWSGLYEILVPLSSKTWDKKHHDINDRRQNNACKILESFSFPTAFLQFSSHFLFRKIPIKPKNRSRDSDVQQHHIHTAMPPLRGHSHQPLVFYEHHAGTYSKRQIWGTACHITLVFVRHSLLHKHHYYFHQLCHTKKIEFVIIIKFPLSSLNTVFVCSEQILWLHGNHHVWSV